jgi:cytosine/adenosine deaminase-related metal-dependent hydrolase
MILRGRYLIDTAGRTTRDAEIAIEGERITAIRKQGSDRTVADSDVTDLGPAALLPGFVNAHTHLELSLARSQVKPQPRFTDWLREVISATQKWTSDDFDASLREGLKHSVEAGTTVLGDIGQGAQDLRAYSRSGMRVRLFHEAIGFDPKTADQIFESMSARIGKHPSGEQLLVGIAPHTPYTVSDRLLRMCARLAHKNGWPVCIHLAETEAELEFLHAGTGEILEFRKDFGLPPEWTPPATSPVRYLERLGFFEKPVTLIHCNYVSEEDFDVIANSDSSVVFCPRSHNYFGHREHPFPKMLDAGITVALGTDSLISSPTLSIFDEMKFIRAEFPETDPAVILRMATTNGLKTLGLPPDTGTLQPGSYADIVGVALPEQKTGHAGDPLEAVFSKGSKVIFSMAAGEILLENPGT